METMSSPTKPAPDGKGAKAAGPASSPHKALITRNLRIAYDEVAGEPIPPRILELLQQMDQKMGGKS